MILFLSLVIGVLVPDPFYVLDITKLPTDDLFFGDKIFLKFEVLSYSSLCGLNRIYLFLLNVYATVFLTICLLDDTVSKLSISIFLDF